ncbi:hypothetical protein TWF481_010639 [Arthrobotrys musiformis]|uniref:Uncharacterized protein n=1 Tax=Arthrobotrys musiformis TaxID=47236 RepID=A0AAV9W2F7_9PEZI
MLNGNRPGQKKAATIAILVLLVIWFLKFYTGGYLLPNRGDTEKWQEKKIDITDSINESVPDGKKENDLESGPVVEVEDPVVEDDTPDPGSEDLMLVPDDENPTPVPDDGNPTDVPDSKASTTVSDSNSPTHSPDGETPVVNSKDPTAEVEKVPTKTKTDEGKSATQSTATEPKPTGEKEKHEKTIIMGKTWKEDATWVKEKLPAWRPIIYAVDSRTDKDYLHVLVNKGKESMPYLTYLIDFYDDLSDVNVFIHAHEDGYPRAWHNEPSSADYSAVQMINLLRLDNVREKGYVNLRCNPNPGCPAELHPQGATFDKGSIEIGWKKLWGHMYGNDEYPESVGVACCAQFAVTREKIHERPKDYYEKLMDWLLTTDEEDAGRVFEYFWHMVFGMPAAHCGKNYHSCICETYDCTVGGVGRRSLDKLAMKRII